MSQFNTNSSYEPPKKKKRFLYDPRTGLDKAMDGTEFKTPAPAPHDSFRNNFKVASYGGKPVPRSMGVALNESLNQQIWGGQQQAARPHAPPAARLSHAPAPPMAGGMPHQQPRLIQRPMTRNAGTGSPQQANPAFAPGPSSAPAFFQDFTDGQTNFQPARSHGVLNRPTMGQAQAGARDNAGITGVRPLTMAQGNAISQAESDARIQDIQGSNAMVKGYIDDRNAVNQNINTSRNITRGQNLDATQYTPEQAQGIRAAGGNLDHSGFLRNVDPSVRQMSRGRGGLVGRPMGVQSATGGGIADPDISNMPALNDPGRDDRIAQAQAMLARENADPAHQKRNAEYDQQGRQVASDARNRNFARIAQQQDADANRVAGSREQRSQQGIDDYQQRQADRADRNSAKSASNMSERAQQQYLLDRRGRRPSDEQTREAAQRAFDGQQADKDRTSNEAIARTRAESSGRDTTNADAKAARDRNESQLSAIDEQINTIKSNKGWMGLDAEQKKNIESLEAQRNGILSDMANPSGNNTFGPQPLPSDRSKLVEGKAYKNSRGQIKVWNGSGFTDPE